jgi:hypothetical protein
MGQLLVPAMIGGGIGALGGAVSGNNPFKSALLGAGLGAGGAGLMGAAGGAGAATAAGGADLAAGTVAPALLGTPTLNASLLTPGAVAGLGATPSVYGGLGASSLLDKTGAFLSNNIGNPLSSLTSRDKLGLGLQGASMLSQPQQMIQPSQGQISRPQFDPSSTLINVSPRVTPTEGNKSGLIDMMARIPLTDEEKMRLQQLAQGYRG